METEIISLRSCLDSPLNDPWPSSDSSSSLPASPTTYRNSNKFSCLLSSSLSLSFPFLYLRPSPFAAVFLFKLVWGCSSLSLAWRDRDLKPAASEAFDSSTASSSRSTELQDIMYELKRCEYAFSNVRLCISATTENSILATVNPNMISCTLYVLSPPRRRFDAHRTGLSV